MNRYEHSQIGSVIIVTLGVAAVLLASGAIGHGSRNALITGVILLLGIGAFYKLTVKIENNDLRILFGVGLIRKKITLSEIESCEPIRIHWWYGWGIHFTPYGWLYNVSGWDAVAIKLRDGKKFAIGTDEPQALIEAIRLFASAR